MKTYKIRMNNRLYELDIELIGEKADMNIQSENNDSKATQVGAKSAAKDISRTETSICAPLPGKVLDICVQVGSKISKGDLLFVIEAMKLENEVFSDHDGIVDTIFVNKGDSVDSGDCLIGIG